MAEPEAASEVTENKQQTNSQQQEEFKTISEALRAINSLRYDVSRQRSLKNKLMKEHEELAATLKARESELNQEIERLKGFETKFQEIETQRREELLNKLPEDKRENYKDLDITLLAKITADFVKDEKVTDSIGGLEKQKIPNLENVLNYEQLSTEQINDLAVKDPVKLSKMYNEFLVRQTKGQ